MLGLEYFSVADLWSPLFLVFMLLLTVGYLLVVGPLSEKLEGAKQVSWMKKGMFIAGMFMLYLAQGGPVSILGHMMFSFHMLTMALSYLVAPPLIMMGIPGWLWRALLKVNPLRSLKFLAKPVVAALLFNGLFSLYHIPAIHDYVMLHFNVHRLYYLVLFVTAMLMWWTLLNPLPESQKGSSLGKMGYIFLNMVLLTPACGLIIFASQPMYTTYSDPNVWAQAMGYCISGDPLAMLEKFGGPTFFNLMSPLVDQQVGGILMKFIQEIIFASILAYVFFHWYKKENREDDDMNPSELKDSTLNHT
ncbi:cytochrome c oxidase assembly factor CtaG [Paenibacillus macquariensis]|uniref:Membrane protein n=1 Tax=Paenibacillus macquariensis TaxID=948756 RepID=A0ABY1K914_9BACL|nr:cytochrome c oxidase assembly factor CtaG [Paenibacillus macquariensis]MEC0091519.1 cytochrome c oxidase assembly factor CtaG [Paenibacillus macquariensis]OAB26651.1 cytochrome c oxidase assembly factor CtaG [Paenibacillus macquariensis subsp. macquariensis]SIR44025.1 putative membrane protein [Paenibacillus macquariensis]